MSTLSRTLQIAIVVVAVLYLGSRLRPPSDGALDMESFARLPVLQDGRIKPLDTVATNSLIILRGKSSVPAQEGKLSALAWLREHALNPTRADDLPVFRVDHPLLKGILGAREDSRKYFSFNDLRPHLSELSEQARALPRESRQRTPYQRAVAKLVDAINLYDQLGYLLAPPPYFSDPTQPDEQIAAQLASIVERGQVRAFPPRHGEPAQQWRNVGESLVDIANQADPDPLLTTYSQLARALRAGDTERFNGLVGGAQTMALERLPGASSKLAFEETLNRLNPFLTALVFYVAVLFLLCLSWFFWHEPLRRAALALAVTTFALHSFGMAARVYILGYAPVINLYSSAVFVGWIAVLAGIILELMHRRGVALIVAPAGGILTLQVARGLGERGDTLEQMRAVLDSNFWLTTHVLTVTMGYGATFVAGLLALIFMARGLFTRTLDFALARKLEGMVYAVVCFALFFSFIGTVLGGIWADQSWGRFWGWDPKENGALMIVLWNALILHARWGKLVGRRGLMQLAVFGNIITAWSWFGTNMLGVGLHSYGFMDAAFFWLSAFVLSQLLMIAIAALPARTWASPQALTQRPA